MCRRLEAATPQAHISSAALRDEAMLSILVMIRDALIAMALSWVGVSLQAAHPNTGQACQGEACQTQSQR